MAHATDIVAYDFRAATYHPGCIIDALPTGPGESFDGWALGGGVYMSPEKNLSDAAAAFGINRMDESSFDSDDFPKVVFSSQVEGEEYCEACGAPIN